jgi:hypothetical protein
MITENLRLWFESAYYLSGIAIAIIAGFGLQQIRLLKQDILTRNQRAAREKAIEYSNRYLTAFVPVYDRWTLPRIKAGISSYKGDVGDFSFKSLTPVQQSVAADRFIGFSHPMNELLPVAAAFTSGVADETLGFEMIGRTFCTTVASNYDLMCIAHDDKECPHYLQIVTLYRMWAPRIRAAEIERERYKVMSDINSHPGVKAIGTS